jgi:glutathione S-transferase
MLNTPIALLGAQGSPYTRKMLALLRYRRIPYRLLSGAAADKAGMPRPAVPLLPTFYLPNAAGEIEAVTDSTPLLRRFEREISARSVQPADPVMRFIDSLLEDYADEWLTKAMYHYRWHYAADSEKAGDVLPMQYFGVCQPEAMVRQAKQQFSQRQISRLAVVGSTLATAPIIEAAYARLLDCLDTHLQQYPFLMGERPGASDFAFYGQLSQMTQMDPTPMALTLARSRRVVAWTWTMEDLSGLEPDPQGWMQVDPLAPSLLALLQEAGRSYVPLMLANAQAVLAGAGTLQTVIDGQQWTQSTVSYQAKCLRWLRQEFAALTLPEQNRVRAILQRADCAALIDAAPATAQA